MTVFEDLKMRGLIAQTTNEEEIKKALENERVTFYIGFDATADSLHVGHLLQLLIIRRLQQAGHLPIVLLGTGTTLIGDPTGKTDMRKMLNIEQINYNAECFRKHMERFIDFSPDKCIVARNGDWLMNLNYVQLLREVGVHFWSTACWPRNATGRGWKRDSPFWNSLYDNAKLRLSASLPHL
jgi:tyrosyl-tRNA synthetase